MPQVEREYIVPGKLKYVVVDFPLTGLHPLAFKSHEAARCAADQGKFWEMHARLFANQAALAPADLEAHAQALGLDPSAFGECLSGGRHADAVRRDMEEGRKLGITGTPTFLLGITDPTQPRLQVKQILTGAQPYERFKSAIEDLLRQAAGQPRSP